MKHEPKKEQEKQCPLKKDYKSERWRVSESFKRTHSESQMRALIVCDLTTSNHPIIVSRRPCSGNQERAKHQIILANRTDRKTQRGIWEPERKKEWRAIRTSSGRNVWFDKRSWGEEEETNGKQIDKLGKKVILVKWARKIENCKVETKTWRERQLENREIKRTLNMSDSCFITLPNSRL